MNIKKYWMMLAIALVSLCTISCGGDDDKDDITPNNGGNENNTEVKTDYTATASVKTTKFDGNNGITFYQDYNNQYNIYLLEGNIMMNHNIRVGGGWQDHGETLVSAHSSECGIKDVGQITNIADINLKDISGGSGRKNQLRYGCEFQPTHGYAIMFTTEDSEQKHMRVFAKDYKLNNSGILEFVTIQYQLY